MSHEHLAHNLLLGLPYFGEALRARQGIAERHRFFRPIVKEVLRNRSGPLRILEVGSWAGSSAVSWVTAIREIGNRGKITCIDSWAPYFDLSKDSEKLYVEMNDAAASGAVFSLFLHNISACHISSFVEYHKGDSRETLRKFPDHSFDLIYIDGSHRYDIVKQDLEQASRLVAEGGIVCGDDLEIQRHDVDLEEHVKFVIAEQDFVYSTSRTASYHPGVTEAVSEILGIVSVWDGFWAARRDANSWANVTLDTTSLIVPQHVQADYDGDSVSHSSQEASTTSVHADKKISIIVPTRKRKDNLVKFYRSLKGTTTHLDRIEVVLVIDDDDDSYDCFETEGIATRSVVVPVGLPMGALNMAGYRACSGEHIMLLNDDVVSRTPGWDEIVLETFRSFPDGVVLLHVNDGIFREKLCTFPLVTRRYCELAGGICPERYWRYRIDDHIYNVFNLLAIIGSRRIVYLPKVEFLHSNFVLSAENSPEYRPDPEIHRVDTELFDDALTDRKALAVQLAEAIDRHRTHDIDLTRELLLEPISDSVSLRKPEYVQILDPSHKLSSGETRVTIGVVTADLRSKYAQACIHAIKAYTHNYDLIILDNNHGPDFNHPREMNRVIAACKTDFLVLMDDDVIVEPGWLDALLSCVTPEVGVVTPLHKSADGKLSYGGVVMQPDRSGHHTGALAIFDKVFAIQTICSAIMLIDVNKCGHFRLDESYSKYFLDIDYGLRIWEAGFQVVCTPFASVTHIGGATLNWSSEQSASLFERQREHFVRSWMDTGRYEAIESGALWSNSAEIRALLDVPKKVAWFLERVREEQPEAALEQAHGFFDWLEDYPAIKHWVAIQVWEACGKRQPDFACPEDRRYAALLGQLEYPVLVERAQEFDIFLWTGCYYALPHSEGGFDRRRAESGGYRDCPIAARLPLIRTMIYGGHKAAVFSELVKVQPERLQPKLLEEGYKGFNLIRCGQVYGIPQLAGAFDIERVLSNDYPGLCQGATPDIVKAEIDRRYGNRFSAGSARNRLRRIISVAASIRRKLGNRVAKPRSRKRANVPRTRDEPAGDARRWVALDARSRSVGSYGAFSITRMEYKFFGIPESYGAFSYDLYRRGEYERCFIGYTITDVKDTIDREVATKSEPRQARKLLLATLPLDKLGLVVTGARSRTSLKLLVGASQVIDKLDGLDCIRVPQASVLDWARDVAAGRIADPRKQLNGVEFDGVVVPWHYPETWGDNSLEVAGAALARLVDIVQSSGETRTYVGENLHRLIYNKAYLASMFQVIPPASGMRVLEVGCSDGLVCDIMVSLGAKSVVGIDVMTTVGCSYPRSPITFGVMNAEALGFPDESFDIVYSIATLEHVPDPVKAIEEMIRVLRPGGHCYIQAAPLFHSAYGHHMFSCFRNDPWIHLRHSKEEIVNILKGTGKDVDLMRDLAATPEGYVHEMLNPNHLNGLTLADFRLDELRRHPQIDILKFNVTRDDENLLTPTIRKEILRRHPYLEQNQLTEHGFEIAFRKRGG